LALTLQFMLQLFGFGLEEGFTLRL